LIKFLSPTGSSFTGSDIAVLRNSPADCFAYIEASSSVVLVDISITIVYLSKIYDGNPVEIFNLICLLMNEGSGPLFGYTIPSYSVMNPADLDTYRRCYCESCHQLKANFGIISTAAVNYDMTFNAMILNAVSKNGIEKQSVNKGVICVLAKRTADNEILKKTAAYTLLLTKWELEDDRHDHPNIRSNAAYLLLGRAIRKAERMYPEYDEHVAAGFETMRRMEENGCADPVKMGRTFASSLVPAMRDIAADPWNEDLEGLFVSLGTMIYLTDAVDDLDEDYMNGTYNPFLVNCERFINKAHYMKENTYATAELMNDVM